MAASDHPTPTTSHFKYVCKNTKLFVICSFYLLKSRDVAILENKMLIKDRESFLSFLKQLKKFLSVINNKAQRLYQ